jgi:predicted RNA-binding Zn-ribbon protein involved in translation (DUF1610 family)
MTEPSLRPRFQTDGVRIHVREKHRAFHCDVCGSRWIAAYEVREYVGPVGEHWIVHCRDGSPVPAPMFGDRCPTCGHISVTSRIDEERESPMQRGLDAGTG